MARIKYIRVSTKEQNTARQEQDKALYDKIYLEKSAARTPTAHSSKRCWIMCARATWWRWKAIPASPAIPATC